MKHATHTLAFGISLIAALTSCSGGSETPNNTDSANAPINNGDTHIVIGNSSGNRSADGTIDWSTAKFVIEHNDADDINPSSIVSIAYGDKIVPIDTITGHAELYPKADWYEMEVLSNAISVCGCWWAGGGDYFYFAPAPNGIAVYAGYQDEGQETPGYHWKLVKEIGE